MTTDLNLKTVLQLPDAGTITGNEFVHLVQGTPPQDVKATVSFIGAGLIHVTEPSDDQPSMAIGVGVDWPMSWRGMVCGYEAGSAGFETDIDLQQVPAISPVLVNAGYTWELPDHVTAFGERAARGLWGYSATVIGQQAGYYAYTYAPVFVGRWAGHSAVGAQLNAIGYQAGSFSDGGYDSNTTTLTSAITATQTGSVQVASISAWSPATLGYANGTLLFLIDQEVIQGHYIDATHISLDVRGANGRTTNMAAHLAGAPVLRLLPSAQCSYVGTESGRYLSGGNNDLHGHQTGYQSVFHDSVGFGYQSLYVTVGYNLVGIGSRANKAVNGHDSTAIGAGATTQLLGTPFTVSTGPRNRTFDIANLSGQPSQNIQIPSGTGAANGWISGQIVNLMWNWSGTYPPAHLGSTNNAYLFTYYKNGSNECLMPAKAPWFWYGSATSDLNPPDHNPPVGGPDTASWPSPENPSVTLYQPVGTVTLTPVLAVNEATAIGSAATATAQNALAVGANANANQTNATAVGEAAAATSDHSSAFGTNAAASASYAQAVGYAATASGGDSVAIGGNASAGGIQSTAIGKTASASADDTVAIGALASASGLDGTAIGRGAAAGFTNSTAIGFGATAPNANSITLGNSSIAHIYAQVTSITAISDRRQKRDIRGIDLGLEFIAKLEPVSYRFRNGDPTLRHGFIAQDVAGMLPKSLSEAAADRRLALVQEVEGNWHMNYAELIAPMVRAIQELARENASLRARIDALESAT